MTHSIAGQEASAAKLRDRLTGSAAGVTPFSSLVLVNSGKVVRWWKLFVQRMRFVKKEAV